MRQKRLPVHFHTLTQAYAHGRGIDELSSLSLSLSLSLPLLPARASVERDPGDDAAFDIVAGSYRGRPRGRGPPGKSDNNNSNNGKGGRTSSPALATMEVEDGAAAGDGRPRGSVARLTAMFESMFARGSGNSGSGSGNGAKPSVVAARVEASESRMPLRGDTASPADDSDDVDDRLASLDVGSLNLLASGRARSGGGGGSSSGNGYASRSGGSRGTGKRGFFDDV
jgi:hypothetical protein